MYFQIVLQTLLGTLPLYSMSFSTHADSDIAKKTSLFKRLHTLTATDTLESVASSYGLSVDELWALNINLYNNRSIFDAIKYGAVVYVPNREEEQKATQQASLVASHLSQIGSTLSSESRVEAFSRLAKGVLLSSTAKSVEEWLGHIGKAQIKLQADDKNDFSGSELDLFIPLYDQPERLAFSQFGFRRIDQRNIMNIGLGQRHYLSDWMLGYNVFFDQQISGNAHRRLGLGGELARDYVKLSANSYYRLGGWKNSTRLEDYDARAANGYDIRTEAYLPYYPQLGGKLMYEQYFGNEVALFGLNERQKNPSALTASVSYTPFPLLNLALEHTIGNSGKNKTGVNLAVNYEINTPWQKQIDPAAVQATRTLAGSRMDLVDRNNNIVLEYRKQQVVTLNLPAKVSGKEKQVLPINYTFNARHGLDRIEWDAADVINAGGNVSDQGNLAYHITFPPYIDGGDNAYVLAGRAVDKKGNYSVSNSTNIYVTGVNINPIKSTITLTPATLPANTTSRSILQLKLSTDAGHAVSGATGNITFAVRDVSGNVPRARTLAQPVVIGDVQEIQTGVYEASVTSGNLVGRFEITPTVRGVQLNPIILTQSADATTATINGSANITISTPTITANATDKTHLEVLVTDALGHPVPGVEVTWVSDLNSPGLEHVTSITNEHGIAENDFSSTTTGTANITVQTGTSPPVQAGTIEIKPDNSTMTVNASNFTVTKTPVVANGTNKAVYQLKVTDKQGNVVPATAVEWSSNIGSFIQGNTTTTDANGETSVELVSTKAELAKVTARIGGKPYTADSVTFIADRKTAQITLLPLSKSSAAANDKDNITLNAKIVDANGNPLRNEKVNWEVPGHQVTFDPATGNTQTNDLGETQITLTSSNVGDVTLNARVEKGDLAVNLATEKLSFTADAVTAKVSGWLAPTDTTLTADGQAQVTYQVVVKDNKGHVVPNSPVHWKTSLGEFVPAQATTAITSTNNSGVAEVALSSTQAGSVTAFAQLTSGNHASEQKENNQAEFIAAMPVSANSSLLLVPKLIIADGKQESTLKFTLRDANHNPVSGLAKDITVTQSPANHITVGNITESAAKGVYQATVSGMKEGSVDLTATVKAGSVSKAQTLTLQADNKTASLKSVTSNQPTAKADGTESITYRAKVIDAQGNASLENVSVGWRTDLGELAAITKTDKSGIATATLKSQQAGSATVTAIVSSTSEMTAAPVIFTAGAISIAHSSSHLSSVDLVADGVTTTQVTVKVNDLNGNSLVGQSGNIKLTAANFPGLVLGQFTEMPNGVYTATLTGTKAGEAEIVTELNGIELIKQKLKLIADVRTAKIGELTPSKSGSLTVGDKVTYRATIKDANDNQLGADIPVYWSVNRDTLISGSKLMSLTNRAGVADVEISRNMQGDALVTATVGRNSKQATAVNFMSGGIDMSQSTANLLTKEITANNLDVATIQVVLRDSKGNPLANLQSQITTSPTSGEHGLDITTQANPPGVYLVNIKGYKAGSHAVTVSVAGNAFPNQMNVKLVGDATMATLADVSVNRTTFKADNVDQVTYTAKVVDVNNNPVENYPVSWRLAQGEGQYQSLSYTGTTGKAETKLSASRLGQYKMEAQVRGVAKVAPDVSTTAGDMVPSQSDFVVDANSIDASGKTKAKLTATLKDKFGNLLKGQTVNVKETHNLTGIKFTSNPMKDNGDGTYSTEVTSTTKGSTKFIASVNGKDLIQQPQLLVGNIIPQLSFDNKNVVKTYTKARSAKQVLKGLPQGVTPHWSSDNSDVAKVDPTTGEIELLKAGVVNISAVTLADNTYAMGTASYQLEVERADPKLSFTKRFSNVTWGQVAAKEQPNVGNSDWANSQPQLKWSSSEPNVAKVDANGHITLFKAGDTSIKATTAQTDQFKAAEAEYVLNINKANLQLNFNASVKQYSVDSKPSDVQLLILPIDLPASAVRWSSSNPSVMNIDSNGRVISVSAGASDIKIVIEKNDFYSENSAKYLAEVYQKPSVSISSTNTVSKGVSGSNSSEWKPAFKGDQMAVNWGVSGSGKFAGPKKVVVQFIEDGSGSKLFEKESTSNLASGSTVIEDTNVKNLVGKRGKFVVKTEGTSGLSSQDQTKIIDVKRLYPDEIWNKVRVKSGHSIYEKGKSVKDCRTSAGFWNDTHHVNLNWGVGIDLGNNQLLEGMEVKLRIDKVSSSYISPKDIVTRNILKTFDEVSTPSSNYIAETLHTDCYDPHNDSVELVLDVEYLGKKTMYKAGSVYWEGLGRTKKDFVEANVQRK
ncbi:Ig-like domain-containing protein [Yersinia mollaretii]|uniref:Ig-like domain-containing protein n=1 Tax=Yersinia mollaretii TaxID=33060 RepID=UPI001E2F3F46|nr:Ig-like domain-containing protein [Yersinia mollaretii]